MIITKKAEKLAKFLMTKFCRALLYKNKFSQHSTSAWGDVCLPDFNEKWWENEISEIDKEIMKKYNVSQNIVDYINVNFQTKTEKNIINLEEKVNV